MLEFKHIKKDLSGQVFGKLKVIKYVGSSSTGRQSHWYCICECGKDKVVTRGNLLLGDTKSCGCLRRLEEGVASLNALYNSYVECAKRRAHEFSLSLDFFKHITKQNCFYCNKEPSQVRKAGRKTGDYVYNGIDRVDNSLGYVENNCVSCCKDCNYLKARVPKFIMEKAVIFIRSSND